MRTYPDLCTPIEQYTQALRFYGDLRMSMPKICYYQAELPTLEHELKAIELEDRHQGGAPRQDCATSWATMAASGDESNESTTTEGERGMNQHDTLQWQTFLRICEQLCKHSKQDRHTKGSGVVRKVVLISGGRCSAHPTDAT